MFFILSVCPCCDDLDVCPDFGMGLDEDVYHHATCTQCQLEYDEQDQQSHVRNYMDFMSTQFEEVIPF